MARSPGSSADPAESAPPWHTNSYAVARPSRSLPAARSICDGLERERTEIAFPTPMALLMKTARLVPVRVWTALWNNTSLPDTRPAEHPDRNHRKQRTP